MTDPTLPATGDPGTGSSVDLEAGGGRCPYQTHNGYGAVPSRSRPVPDPTRGRPGSTAVMDPTPVSDATGPRHWVD